MLDKESVAMSLRRAIRAFCAFFVLHGGATADSYGQVAAGWLRSVRADKQMGAIDRQLRGFDMAMVEFGSVHRDVLRCDRRQLGLCAVHG